MRAERALDQEGRTEPPVRARRPSRFDTPRRDPLLSDGMLVVGVAGDMRDVGKDGDVVVFQQPAKKCPPQA